MAYAEEYSVRYNTGYSSRFPLLTKPCIDLDSCVLYVLTKLCGRNWNADCIGVSCF